MLNDHQDAFGHEIYDYFKNKSGHEIIERDDGYFDVSGGAKAYFTEYKNWPSHEKRQ
jgi:hypothetical protein